MHLITKIDKRRPKVTAEQLQIMEEYYARSGSVKGREKQLLSERLGITERSLQIWFQNRRAKDKAEERKKTLNLKRMPRLHYQRFPWPVFVPYGLTPPPLMQSQSPILDFPTSDRSNSVISVASSGCSSPETLNDATEIILSQFYINNIGYEHAQCRYKSSESAFEWMFTSNYKQIKMETPASAIKEIKIEAVSSEIAKISILLSESPTTLEFADSNNLELYVPMYHYKSTVQYLLKTDLALSLVPKYDKIKIFEQESIEDRLLSELLIEY